MKLTDREQLLVALGAAMGSNCVPCIESILPKARAAGIADGDLQEAVDLADVVRRKPARKVLETARELLTGRAPEPEEGPCPLEAIGTAKDDSACCG
jgi:alkylhydroperoxidase/carboxymuconolactone decarboxylase family protein YurZ